MKSTDKEWPTVDENGDYIWRFDLDAKDASLEDCGNAFVELFRRQLDEMLKLIVLTSKGKRVRVDGFRFVNNLDETHSIWETDEPSGPS